ncbi:hypothetical protein EV702DRAFT_1050499 [Suillus placidus]|uniref:Uncharacterized protein n=1 Tax=Suillus placidus TaxID=48579 RepID=A0A9P6ZI08_9AGAM|nr:hypothetical protein EV702DRAFT_1050499 [Suillus placidus]
MISIYRCLLVPTQVHLLRPIGALAVHPLRNLIRFIRLDLSRPCGIDSSSVARGGNTAPILPNQSSFEISPILKVARLDPSRDNRPLSTNQGPCFRLHESFKDQRKRRLYSNQLLCKPEIDALLGLNFTQGFQNKALIGRRSMVTAIYLFLKPLLLIGLIGAPLRKSFLRKQDLYYQLFSSTVSTRDTLSILAASLSRSQE